MTTENEKQEQMRQKGSTNIISSASKAIKPPQPVEYRDVTLYSFRNANLADGKGIVSGLLLLGSLERAEI